MVSQSSHGRHPLAPHCDTRPFRSRPLPAYAGSYERSDGSQGSPSPTDGGEQG